MLYSILLHYSFISLERERETLAYDLDHLYESCICEYVCVCVSLLDVIFTAQRRLMIFLAQGMKTNVYDRLKHPNTRSPHISP